jgi:hypothetical protein
MWSALGVLCAISFGFSPTALAAAQNSPPPGPPGPPPGAGSGFLSRPAGTAPLQEATGPAATIPAHVTGPALMTGVVRVHQLQFAVSIACRTSGRVSVTAGAIRSGVLARGTYTCRNGHASAQLQLRRADARRLATLGPTLTSVTLGKGGATARLSLTLETGAQSPGYWSDGGLQCSFLGSYEPYLVAPDFTDTPPVVIDVRPWVAWYTPSNGWRWLGTVGVNASRWYRWTATPSGIEQWTTPARAVNPWTWAPIHVHPGDDTYAIGVFEVMYWYTRPHYTWRYTRSSLGGNSLTTYCNYS